MRFINDQAASPQKVGIDDGEIHKLCACNFDRCGGHGGGDRIAGDAYGRTAAGDGESGPAHKNRSACAKCHTAPLTLNAYGKKFKESQK